MYIMGNRSLGGVLTEITEWATPRVPAPEPAAPAAPTPGVPSAPWGEPGPTADPEAWEKLMAEERQQFNQILIIGAGALAAWYLFLRKPPVRRRRKRRR